MKSPPRLGDFIRTEILEPAGLSVTAAATALRVSRPALSSLLNGKASLSGEMALRIEKAFGVKMDTLMRMQASYEIAQIRKREGAIACGPTPSPRLARSRSGALRPRYGASEQARLRFVSDPPRPKAPPSVSLFSQPLHR
jgi:addiction module HigA family antidote